MKMILLQVILCSFLFSCGTSQQDEQAIAYDKYVIVKPNGENNDAVTYLYHHFKKRAAAGIVLMESVDTIPTNTSKVQFINVAIDSQLSDDYQIIKKDNNLEL